MFKMVMYSGSPCILVNSGYSKLNFLSFVHAIIVSVYVDGVYYLPSSEVEMGG